MGRVKILMRGDWSKFWLVGRGDPSHQGKPCPSIFTRVFSTLKLKKATSCPILVSCRSDSTWCHPPHIFRRGEGSWDLKILVSILKEA